MAGLIKHEKTESNPELQKVAALLGGARILGRLLKDPLDAHEVLLRGLPGKALIHLIDSLVVLLPFGMISRVQTR